MTGCILSAITDRLDTELTTDTLTDAYHEGRLSRFLPDDQCWLAVADSDGDITSLESISVEQGRSIILGQPCRAGALILRYRKENGDERIRVSMFPDFESAERFNEVAS